MITIDHITEQEYQTTIATWLSDIVSRKLQAKIVAKETKPLTIDEMIDRR